MAHFWREKLGHRLLVGFQGSLSGFLWRVVIGGGGGDFRLSPFGRSPEESKWLL
ncbi:MAG: hypothetical protein LBT86_09525 [Deltaproteobacteria bacterium]|nr:hypothetical protein [Deltaproteobacteria bacterium]